MTKNEYLNDLRARLSRLKPADRDSAVAVIGEMIDDRMEDGLDEEAAVAAMDDAEKAAFNILADAQANGELKPEKSKTEIALVAAGSPVWLPLLIAAAVVALAIYICVWAVIVAMFASVGSMALGGVCAGAASLVASVMSGDVGNGLFVFGCGLVTTALGLALFAPVLSLTRLLARSSARLFRLVWGKLFKRKEETK